ncbi:MAG: MarR family transcriptional regulator [Proteobacteria bacterium]|nr:MarR family transcriptional regulator [Pseudomonadota bacterium]
MKHYDAHSYTVGDSIGYLIRHCASLMRQQLELAFEGQGLTFVQWVTLMRLRDNPRLTAGDLCRDLHHDSGAFSRVVDHLESSGLVSRERSASDRRVVQLKLTAAGRQAVTNLIPIVVERLNHALADFSAADVATLARLLRRLSARLEEVEGDRATERPRGARP